MILKSIHIKKQYIFITILTVVILLTFSLGILRYFVEANIQKTEDKKYIKWVEFNATLEAMEKTSKLDINSHINNDEIKLNWIELLSYLATKYGGDFKLYKQSDLDGLVNRLKSGEKIEDVTKDMKLYSYYFEAYDAILNQFIGEYEIEIKKDNNEKEYQKKYGIKAFLPIAKNYGFSHYDDFGNARSYGYKRIHLGNDLMGSIGTPIIAVESGVVEAARMESIWWMESRNKKL